MNDLPFQDLSGFLNWVGTPAGLAALGAAISVFVKDMDWFESLSSKQKSVLMFVTMVVLLPLIFIYIPSKLPEEFLAEAGAIFNIFMLGAIAYLTSQVTHEVWNQRVLKRKSKKWFEAMSSMNDIIDGSELSPEKLMAMHDDAAKHQ